MLPVTSQRTACPSTSKPRTPAMARDRRGTVQLGLDMQRRQVAHLRQRADLGQPSLHRRGGRGPGAARSAGDDQRGGHGGVVFRLTVDRLGLEPVAADEMVALGRPHSGRAGGAPAARRRRPLRRWRDLGVAAGARRGRGAHLPADAARAAARVDRVPRADRRRGDAAPGGGCAGRAAARQPAPRDAAGAIAGADRAAGRRRLVAAADRATRCDLRAPAGPARCADAEAGRAARRRRADLPRADRARPLGRRPAAAAAAARGGSPRARGRGSPPGAGCLGAHWGGSSCGRNGSCWSPPEWPSSVSSRRGLDGAGQPTSMGAGGSRRARRGWEVASRGTMGAATSRRRPAARSAPAIAPAASRGAGCRAAARPTQPPPGGAWGWGLSARGIQSTRAAAGRRPRGFVRLRPRRAPAAPEGLPRHAEAVGDGGHLGSTASSPAVRTPRARPISSAPPAPGRAGRRSAGWNSAVPASLIITGRAGRGGRRDPGGEGTAGRGRHAVGDAPPVGAACRGRAGRSPARPLRHRRGAGLRGRRAGRPLRGDRQHRARPRGADQGRGAPAREPEPSLEELFLAHYGPAPA